MHQLPAEISRVSFGFWLLDYNYLILRQLSFLLIQGCSHQALNSLLTSWPQQDRESSLSTTALECHLNMCFARDWSHLGFSLHSRDFTAMPQRSSLQRQREIQTAAVSKRSRLQIFLSIVSPWSAGFHFCTCLKQYFKSIFSQNSCSYVPTPPYKSCALEVKQFIRSSSQV